MNRQQRRFLKQKNKKAQRINQNTIPTTEMLKASEILRGTETDVGLLKGLCLAHEPNPEPISISFYSYENGVRFNLLCNQRANPVICLIQEKDGSFSMLKANQDDWTEWMVEFEFEIAEKIPHTFLNRTFINAETVKFFNFVYEGLGIECGNLAMLDVSIHIFSKQSYDEMLSQAKELSNYFTRTYQGARNLMIGMSVETDKVESLLKKMS